jgi:hypothetical protein
MPTGDTLLVTTFTLILITLALISVMVAAFINFGDEIQTFLLTVLIRTNLAPKSIEGKLLNRYKVSSNEMVRLGRIVGGFNYGDGPNKKSLGVTINGRHYPINAANYPFLFKQVDILPDDGVFKDPFFKDLQYSYVVRYGLRENNRIISFSQDAYFLPVIDAGGATFNGTTFEPLFSFINGVAVYGRAGVVRLDEKLVSPDMFLTYSLQFYDIKDKKENGITYLLSVYQTTRDPESTFTNPEVKTGFIARPNVNINDAISLSDYFPQILGPYSTHYKLDEDDDALPSVAGASKKNLVPFTVSNSFLLVPDPDNFRAAIIDYAAKHNVKMGSTPANIAEVARLTAKAANLIDARYQ